MKRLVVVLALLATSVASAQCPPEARVQMDEALRLALANDHRAAARAYRQVAEWPGEARFPERARALHAAATELEAARDYEEALATYREVERRFPESDFAGLAGRAARNLDPPCGGGIAFRRAQTEAWDVLLPALARDDRGDPAARPGIERGLVLLRELLARHREHPRAVEVAVAISDALVRLDRLDEAVAAAEEALELARAGASRPGATTEGRALVVTAERALEDAARAVRRRAVRRGSVAVLLLATALVAALRPWRHLGRRHLAVAGATLLLQSIVAVAAASAARWIRTSQDPESFLLERTAALIVLAPASFGSLVSIAVAGCLPSRRGALLAALAGPLCALAVAALLLHRLGFLHYVPEL